MSLPWRHWTYIIGTLLFGLFFVTLAPFPFLVRVLVLLIPFFTALGLAMPYGGLHMDEWLLMALKYRARPSAKTISPEELRGLSPEEMQRLLEAGLEEEPAAAADFAPTGFASAGGWTANGTALDQGAPSTHQIYLTGTHGILRRSYSGLPESNGTGAPSATSAGGAPPGTQGQVGDAWQPTAGQAPYSPSAPPVTAFQPSTGQPQYGQPSGSATPFQVYGGQAQYPQPFQPTRTGQSIYPTQQNTAPTSSIAPGTPDKPKKRRPW